MENIHDIIRRPQKSHLQIRNRIECDTSKVPVFLFIFYFYENQWVTASEGFQFVITLYSHESVDAYTATQSTANNHATCSQ